MTLKEKRLRIISLAMDINEKYGAVCFVYYQPHVDMIDVNMYKSPWTEEGDFINYVAYSHNNFAGSYNVVTTDELIGILEKVLEDGLK